MSDLFAAARAWHDVDPDPQTREQLAGYLQANDEAQIRESFAQRLEFGTAGMRGAMGPGPNRMNRALVRVVTAGLADYLRARVENAAGRGVVVGYDGRRNSRAFAEDAAAVLGARGLRVYLADTVIPTPILAHAVTYLRCAAGVMVTASHNPPADNGYKVYAENGAQILSPMDQLISEAIDQVGGPGSVSLAELGSLRDIGALQPIPAAAWEDYQQAVLRLRVHRQTTAETGVKAVYTAMHGVGYAPLARLLAAAGHAPLIAVEQQRDPDGAFPTVAFPNPEEPGAMDLAFALASAEGADLVLANDPDADRLALAIPDGRGGWRQLTGNEVGLLLADDLLTHGPPDGERLIATTVVSTSLTRKVAAAHGAILLETLTGFKWIANAALRHTGRLVLGFEESLGYCAGEVVRDKDGLSAALLALDLAAWCRARGATLLQHLESFYRRYGYNLAVQRSIRFPGLEGQAQMAAIMARLRQDPPRQIGGRPVATASDGLAGTATDLATGAVRLLDLPPSDLLAFDLAGGGRVLARPSGTESKIKFYFEVESPLGEGEPLAAAEARAAADMASLQEAFLALALQGTTNPA